MAEHSPGSADGQPWVIWNGAAAILVMASIGRVEAAAGGRRAWLEQPFDMVGPFSLDELETVGRIAFAACIVMSRQRWQEDQRALRSDAYARRRAAQQRLHEESARFNGHRPRHRSNGQPADEAQYRETLRLPPAGKLEALQIKTAFRRLAQKLHPDVGGSHEQFLRITAARNALLEFIS